MKKVASLLKRRFENIITYLTRPITNATSESINAKIQWVKYTVRGFRDKQNFINAIDFHCGGLDLVKLGDCTFDVVAYSKFSVVECKLGRKASDIGHAFGQVGAYAATITKHGREFVVAYSKKLSVPMHMGRWLEAIDADHQIRVAFSVALTQGACERTELLISLKKAHPDVGIVRVKPNGVCRDPMRVGRERKKDDSLNKAKPVTIEILREEPAAG